NEIIVGIAAIKFVCVAINSTSSLIVDECERTISIPEAINAVNDSIFCMTETIIDATPAIISGTQIIVSVMEMIISGTETIICAFLMGFFAAQIVISAAEKTAGAVPAGPLLVGKMASAEGVDDSVRPIDARATAAR